MGFTRILAYLLLTTPFACYAASPIFNNTYVTLSTNTLYTCGTYCSAANFVNAGVCLSGVNVGAGYLTAAVIAATGLCNTTIWTYTAGSGIPSFSGNTLYGGVSSCTTVMGVNQPCICAYNGTVFNETVLSTGSASSIMSSMDDLMSSGPLARVGYYPYGSGSYDGQSIQYWDHDNQTPLYNFHEIQSAATDSNKNVYFTVKVRGVATSLLYMYKAPYNNQPPVYTGISTCSFVFNDAAGVYCIGRDGLIQVV